MGLLAQSLRFAGAKSGVQNPSQWLMDWLGAGKSSTGLDVHETTAMQSMAVYACVKVLAETVSSLPLPVYHRLDGGGKERAPQHPNYRILHDYPNPEMTSADFRATMITHLMLWGNCYAEIERDQAGRPIALWPLRPDRMQIWRGLEVPYELEYWYSLYTGGMAILAPYQVLHIKNLSIDGIRGLSPIAHQREAVGLAIALESYAGHFFGNDATPGGFLSHPGKLSEKARETLKLGWEAGHRGLDNANRMAVFEEGVTFQKVGIPPEDSQFLQSRQFQLTEIARMYRVPAHLLGDLGRVTHANIEHLGIDFVTHTIRPLVVNWEQAITQKLFTEKESTSYFAEFVVDALLRGDLASRYAAYAVGRQWGFLNVDEIRDKENLNPLPDGQGQEYLSPLNMIESGTTPVAAPDSAPGPAQGDVEDQANRHLASRKWFQHELDAVLRIERERVLQSAQKLLRKGDLRGFGRFLSEFYGEKLPSIFQDRLAPVFGDQREQAREYIADLAIRHSQTSLKVLQDSMAGQNGHSLDAIEGLVATWETSRALDRFAVRQFGEIMDGESTTPTGPPQPDPAELVRAVGMSVAEAIRASKPEPPVVNVKVEAPEAVVIPAPVINNAFEGTTVNVEPAAVTVQPADVNIDVRPAEAHVTVEGDTVNVQPAAVTVPVTVEGDTVTHQIQQPDVTILPAEVNVRVEAPKLPTPKLSAAKARLKKVTHKE